jgi:hypothetical protein
MAVPAHAMAAFRRACLAHPEVAHAPLNLDLLLNPSEFHRRPPFRSLRVKARDIVADGLPPPPPGAAPLRVVETDDEDGCATFKTVVPRAPHKNPGLCVRVEE